MCAVAEAAGTIVRPARRAASAAAAPRRCTRTTGRGSRSGARLLEHRIGQPTSHTPNWCGGTPCRSRPPAAVRASARGAPDRRSCAAGAGRQRHVLLQRCQHLRLDAHGCAYSMPPCTTRWPTPASVEAPPRSRMKPIRSRVRRRDRAAGLRPGLLADHGAVGALATKRGEVKSPRSVRALAAKLGAASTKTENLTLDEPALMTAIAVGMGKAAG